MKLHHVGIITSDIKSGIQHHKALFNFHPITEIVEDPVQKVAVILLSGPEEGMPIELIAPLTDDSPISNILKEKTRLYHLCFIVDDIEKTLKHAEDMAQSLFPDQLLPSFTTVKESLSSTPLTNMSWNF